MNNLNQKSNQCPKCWQPRFANWQPQQVSQLALQAKKAFKNVVLGKNEKQALIELGSAIDSIIRLTQGGADPSSKNFIAKMQNIATLMGQPKSKK